MLTSFRTHPMHHAHFNEPRSHVKRANAEVLKFRVIVLLTALLCGLAFNVLTSSAVRAEPVTISPATVEKMQTIISAQIDAFRAEDAEAAYEYASPAIKMRFPSPSQFALMVQRGYPAVYSPKSFEFFESANTSRGPVQRVEFIAKDGQIWGGIYMFYENSKGDLTISGVYLRRENERQI
ncbi:MAG: DUF4864 domain-containing protein [Pseudomonadota bacterium]